MKRTLKNSIRISIGILLLVSCNLFKPKYNQPIITYRIDTLIIKHFRYKLDCGKEMGYFDLKLAYPVFISDSLPKVLKDYNNTIKDTVYKHALYNIREYYKCAFPDAFDGRKRNCDSLIDEYRGYEHAFTNIGRAYWENTLVWALDTVGSNINSYVVNVYIGKNYISLGVVIDYNRTCENMNRAVSICYNFILDENRFVNLSECLKLKPRLLKKWENYARHEKNGYQGFDSTDYYPNSFRVSSVKSDKEYKFVSLYCKFSNDDPIECPLDTVKKYFDVKYIDQ